MSDPVWPATLPQRLVDRGLKIQFPDTIIRSETDSGVAKTRQRFTKGIKPVSGLIVLNEEQLEILEEFYTVTLNGGAGVFLWSPPYGSGTVRMRFAATPEIDGQDRPIYSANLALEILP